MAQSGNAKIGINLSLTPEQEAQLDWLRQAIGASDLKETIFRAISVLVTLKRRMKSESQLFLHTSEGQR